MAISGGTFAGDGDVLAADTTGTSITASYNSTTEMLTLTGTDTLAHYQQVLDSVTFTTPSDNPTTFGSDPTRTVTWTVVDDQSTNNTSTRRPPRSPSRRSTTRRAWRPSPASRSPRSATADALAGAVGRRRRQPRPGGATVSITGGTFAGDGDVLSANTAGTSITASYNSATETLTLSGSDTLAHYQQVLDSVTFVSTSENPTNFGTDTTRTVTWVINDGTLNSTKSTTLAITAVNDAPVATIVPTTYSAAGSRNLKNTGMSVSDIDSLGGVETVRLSVTEGTLTVTAGTSGAAVSGNGTSTVTITGTLAQINALLNTDEYEHGR